MAESRTSSVGVIGLGDMGIGIARNLVAAGFDLRPERVEQLADLGGRPAANCAQVGAGADAVFVMVLSGGQASDALLGTDAALEGMRAGSTVIVTATILPAEVRTLQGRLPPAASA